MPTLAVQILRPCQTWTQWCESDLCWKSMGRKYCAASYFLKCLAQQRTCYPPIISALNLLDTKSRQDIVINFCKCCLQSEILSLSPGHLSWEDNDFCFSIHFMTFKYFLNIILCLYSVKSAEYILISPYILQ